MTQKIMNGRPTAPHVDKIFARVKEMKEGEVITHLELTKIIGEDKDTQRYRTIVAAAKRRVFRELNIELKSVAGEGYRNPIGFDQLRSGVGTIASGVRRIGRGVKVGAVISDDRLPNPNHRAARDRIVMQGNYLQQIAKTKRKELQLTIGQPEHLPRLPAAQSS